MTENPIDTETIAMLKEVLAEDFADLMTTFFDDVPLRIADIQAGVADSDFSMMEKAAHTLKGSSSNVGAIALSKACDSLVQQCRAGQLEDAQAAFEHIEQEFARAKPLLQSYIQEFWAVIYDESDF